MTDVGGDGCQSGCGSRAGAVVLGARVCAPEWGVHSHEPRLLSRHPLRRRLPTFYGLPSQASFKHTRAHPGPYRPPLFMFMSTTSSPVLCFGGADTTHRTHLRLTHLSALELTFAPLQSLTHTRTPRTIDDFAPQHTCSLQARTSSRVTATGTTGTHCVPRSP